MADWERLKAHFKGEAHSLYFGGGTPSLAVPSHIADIIDAVAIAPDAEITLEVNPGTISAHRLQEFHRAGVNRVSVGVQTFNPDFARLLNRGHTVHHAHELLEVVQQTSFDSWSLDIMFALPDQSVADIERELESIIRVQPPHISLYGLTIKEGTPFERAVEQGKLTLPSDDVWRSQYERIVTTLEQEGWQRYEVSNFARPGHRAVHNESIWKGGFYAALGPGAHGFLPSGERIENHGAFEPWLLEGVVSRDRPTPRQTAMDLVLTTVRHIDGLDLSALAALGFTVDGGVLEFLTGCGLVKIKEHRVQLVGDGWALADGVILRLINGMCSVSSLP